MGFVCVIGGSERMGYMDCAVVAGLKIEGPYSDGDFALSIYAPFDEERIIYLTPKQMMTLAENLIDRLPTTYLRGGAVLELE
tara:strand:- start:33 stop:278 length:246 start_codon:yes stop_codon:yes gene_type:complete